MFSKRRKDTVKSKLTSERKREKERLSRERKGKIKR